MIAVFSGTGNSLSVARRLSALLGDEIILIGPDNGPAPGSGRIIWVFPVYSWGLPPVVADFIRRNAPALRGRGHYCVMTCGDDAGLADRRWARSLRRAGASDTRGAWTVVMPNTYVCMKGFDVDPAEVAARKIERSGARVTEIAAEIAAGSRKTDVLRGRFAWIKSRVIYPWFVRHAMSPEPFHTVASCVSCGLCARSCPLHNIRMAGDRPQWGADCTLCLRCYHICPQRAVRYGKATERKGQVRCRI